MLLSTFSGLLMLCQAATAQSPFTDPSTLAVNVRMVEVYASVSDGHGKPVKGLTANHFRVIEDGRFQRIAQFEPQTAALTIALLIDTTGSMAKQLPQVKNAIARLLEEMKPEDSFGLFSFTNQLTVLHPFSRDRTAALRALLGTQASGRTALYDSLAQLARNMSRLSGKKAILIFTDGDDNASLLPIQTALKIVQDAGIPVYCLAQGRALTNAAFLRLLEEISRGTGGIAFKVYRSEGVVRDFDLIARDLQGLYLLVYYPDESGAYRKFRKIHVSVLGFFGLQVRAKKGYWP
jgi:Ca-activated chloride channel homolog